MWKRGVGPNINQSTNVQSPSKKSQYTSIDEKRKASMPQGQSPTNKKKKMRAFSANYKDNPTRFGAKNQIRNPSEQKSTNQNENSIVANSKSNTIMTIKEKKIRPSSSTVKFYDTQKNHSTLKDSTSKLRKEMLIAEVSFHLKKGSANFSQDAKRALKQKPNMERYDQDGRAVKHNIEKKNRKLKTMSKVDVPITNSTYREYNNYLTSKEKKSLNK